MFWLTTSCTHNFLTNYIVRDLDTKSADPDQTATSRIRQLPAGADFPGFAPFVLALFICAY